MPLLLNNRVMVFDGPNNIHIEERPIPTPAPDEVLIRVAFTGICGSDLHGYTGKSGRRTPGMVMGHESSGWVCDVGANSKKTLIGERVTFNPAISCVGSCGHGIENHCQELKVIGVDPKIQGAFADYISVPSNRLVALNGISFQLGACIEPMAVAVQAVRRSGLQPGESILISGGGMIGQCIAQVARAEGCENVTISESMNSRRDFAGSLGFNTTTPERVSELSKFDRAFDAVGIDATAAATISAIKKGGTVCFVGLGLPSISVPLSEVVVAERNIIGSFAYTDEAFERARDLILDNKLTVQELIGQDTDFEGVATAFSDLASSKRTDLKVLMSTGEHEQN